MPPVGNKRRKDVRRRRKVERARTVAVDYNSDSSSSSSSCLSQEGDENANTMTFDPTEFRRMHLDFVAGLKRNKSMANVSDVDRCFKKIHEGLETVDLMWARFEAAAVCTVKEKLEQELKKEIKKLQRLREQVRAWIALETGIKDQSALIYSKCLIESFMAKFRSAEKGMRVKPFSHVGLAQTGNPDPVGAEADNLENWIKKVLRKLAFLVDEAESQIEKKGTKDTENVQELEDWIRKYQYHTGELEAVLRLLNALRIDEDEAREKLPIFISQFSEVKEALSNFTRNHKQSDFIDDEYPYESIDGLADIKQTALDLLLQADGPQVNEEAGDMPDEGVFGETGPGTTALISSEGPSTDSNVPSPETRFKEVAGEEAMDSATDSRSSPSSRGFNTEHEDSGSDEGRRRGKGEDGATDTGEKYTLSSDVSSSEGSPTEMGQMSSPTGSAYKRDEGIKTIPTPLSSPRAYSTPGAVSIAWQGSHKEVSPRIVASNWRKPVEEVSPRVAAANWKKQMDQLAADTGRLNLNLPSEQTSQEFAGSSGMKCNFPRKEMGEEAGGTPVNAWDLPPSKRDKKFGGTSKLWKHPNERMSQEAASASGMHCNLKEMDEQAGGTSGNIWNLPLHKRDKKAGGTSEPWKHPNDRINQDASNTSGIHWNLPSQQFASHAPSMAEIGPDQQIPQGAASLNWNQPPIKKVPEPQPCSSSTEHSRFFSIHLSDVKDSSGGPMAEESAALFKTAYIPKDLAANPCGPAPYTQQQKRDLLRLNAAHEEFNLFADDFCVLAPLDRVFPKTPFPTPSYYPQVNLDIKFYENMSDETLCFAFFNHAGTQMQILVAQILQAREYRFYKKEGTWFRRTTPPMVTTDYYERGNYIMFSLELKEFVGIENFFFEYQYLEIFPAFKPAA